MKLLTPFAAIIAAAAAGHIYTTQPAEAYANSAEIYQSALEYQQQGLYSDQSHAFSGQSAGADQSHVYSGQHGDSADQSAYGHSRPAGEKTARILSFESTSDGHGYQYAFETENGLKAQEVGQTIGHEKGTEAHGAYSYKGDDGQVYTVTYTADEHGFHAQGAHLPTPPPIPEAIAKSLEQNAKDEAAGIYDDGKYTAQHESYQEQPLHHGHASGQQVSQAFQYETAIQHEFQPSHQNYQLAGHQSQGHQGQEGGHQSGHQIVGQIHGHQSAYQLIGQEVGHQSGHQIVGQIHGHQGGQQGYQGQHEQQPRGFQPSGYHTVQVDGYHKY